MNILVTGANGFLGTALINKLDREKNYVRAFVRDISRAGHLKDLNVEIFQGNLWGKKGILNAMEKVDIVFHLAATIEGRWGDYFEGTVLGTERMVQAALEHKVSKFVYVSSISVYGIPDSYGQFNIGEDTPYATKDLTNYIRSKIEAEKIVLKHIRENNLPGVIIRPGIIYGPGGKMFLPRLGYKIRDRFFVLIGMNDISLPVTYVDNVADALLLAAGLDKSTGEAYNVVDDLLFTKKEYINAISKGTNGRIYHIRISYIAVSAISSVLEVLGRYVSPFKKINFLLPPFHLKSCAKGIAYSNKKIKEKLGWIPKPIAQEYLKDIFSQGKLR